jgi:hypothetical protein
LLERGARGPGASRDFLLPARGRRCRQAVEGRQSLIHDNTLEVGRESHPTASASDGGAHRARNVYSHRLEGTGAISERCLTRWPHVALITLIFQAIARIPALGLSFPLFFASGYLPFVFYQRMYAFMAATANKALFSYPSSPLSMRSSRFILQLVTDTMVAILPRY